MTPNFLLPYALWVVLGCALVYALQRLRFFSFPEYRRLRRSDPYHEAIEFAELETVVYTRTVIGYGLTVFVVAVLLGSPLPGPLALIVADLPWVIIGAVIAFIIARRVWRTPMLYAEQHRLLREMVEEGSIGALSFGLTEAQWKLTKLSLKHTFVTHAGDTFGWLLIMPALLLYLLGGIAVLFSAVTVFALAIHVSWYGWKRWYLLPRVRRAIATTQVMFHVVDEAS